MNGCSGRRRLLPLAVVTVVVTVLAAADVLPSWPGLPHLLALPPVDLFADLRVLLTQATSVPAFVLLLVLVLTVRVLAMAVMLGGLNWATVRFAALYYGIVLLPMLVGAQLDYMAFAMLFARLFWPAVALVAVLGLLAGPVPWQDSPRLRTAVWRTWRGGLRVGIMLPYAAVIVLLGVVTNAWPEPMVTVALVPVSALATGFTIVLLSRPPRPGAQRRLAVAAAASTVAGTVFIATRPHEPAPLPPPREGSMMVMSGINSSSGNGAVFHTRPEKFGLTCDQIYYYSYAGPGDGQPRGVAKCPIRTGAPFEAVHTHRPMAEQAALFAEQVRDLPRPLMVMAHSHAAWVAWTAVAGGMAPRVDVLVLNGPFRQSIQGYPPPGENGPGKTAGDLLRLSVHLGNLFGANHEPDSPAARETLADPTAPTAIFARPLPPGVRAIAVHATVDLPLQPSGWRLPIEHNTCPLRVAHSSLPGSDATIEEVNRFLDGRSPPPCPSWRDWGVPITRGFSVPAARAHHTALSPFAVALAEGGAGAEPASAGPASLPTGRPVSRRSPVPSSRRGTARSTCSRASGGPSARRHQSRGCSPAQRFGSVVSGGHDQEHQGEQEWEGADTGAGDGGPVQSVLGLGGRRHRAADHALTARSTLRRVGRLCSARHNEIGPSQASLPGRSSAGSCRVTPLMFSQVVRRAGRSPPRRFRPWSSASSDGGVRSR